MGATYPPNKYPMEKVTAGARSAPMTAAATPGKELLAQIRLRIKNARGAIESGQTTDKDVHGSLTKALEMIDRLAAKPTDEWWQPIETCPKADYKSYYLFNELWENSWSGVQRANWFDGVWVFDSGLSLTDCETKFNPVMWHPDTTPRPPSTTEPKQNKEQSP